MFYPCIREMLQYCHVFMLPTFKAYTCQQYVCVLSALLATNGQTWHEYALTAVNSPMRLIKGYNSRLISNSYDKTP